MNVDKEKNIPKVGIIMPCYNSEQFLPTVLESIMKQTEESWILFIVDDCSVDGTPSILEKYRLLDSRIKVHYFSCNQGVDKARRFALDHIEPCEFIAFCDSDDIWESKKLESQIKFMVDKNSDITCSFAYFIDKNFRKTGKGVNPPFSFGYDIVLKKNPIINSSAMLKYGIATSVKYPIDGGTEDYEYWLSILRSKKIIVDCIPEYLCGYMVRQSSVSSNKLKAVKRNWFVYRYYENLSIAKSLCLIINYALIKIFKIKEKKINHEV